MSANHSPVIRSINGRNVDVADPDAVAQFLGELDAHAKSLAEKVSAGEKTRGEQEVEVKRLAEELRVTRQRQAEHDAARDMAPGSASERELVQRFIDNDGKLFMRGAGNDMSDSDMGKGLRREAETGLLTTRPVNEQHHNLQRATEALYAAAVIFKGNDAFNHDGSYRPSVIRDLPDYQRVQTAWKSMPAGLRKAFDDQSGSGGDFIPTPLLMTPIWQTGIYDPDGVLDIIEDQGIDSNSVELPVGTTRPVPYKGGGASGNNPAALSKSGAGTDKLTLSVEPMYVLIPVHEDARADSLVPAMPFLTGAMADSLAIAQRFNLLSGNPDGDTDTLNGWDLRGYFGSFDAGSIDYRRVFKGLRTIALDGSNEQARASLTLTQLMTDINSVGGTRGAPADMPIVTSYEGYYKNFATLDNIVDASKYGDRKVIAAGERANIMGHPIIATDAMPADLASTGKYTGSGATTGAVIFNRRMFRRLYRNGEGLELRTQPDITTGVVYIRMRQRVGFQNLNAGTDAGVRYLVNMPV